MLHIHRDQRKWSALFAIFALVRARDCNTFTDLRLGINRPAEGTDVSPRGPTHVTWTHRKFMSLRFSVARWYVDSLLVRLCD